MKESEQFFPTFMKGTAITVPNFDGLGALTPNLVAKSSARMKQWKQVDISAYSCELSGSNNASHVHFRALFLSSATENAEL
jgi:hypothetical protein